MTWGQIAGAGGPWTLDSTAEAALASCTSAVNAFPMPELTTDGHGLTPILRTAIRVHLYYYRYVSSSAAKILLTAVKFGCGFAALCHPWLKSYGYLR